MPNVTFIWKYENENSAIAIEHTNVYLSGWIPQAALLSDARLSLFITHGGIASTNEVAFMGKPAIVVCFSADCSRFDGIQRICNILKEIDRKMYCKTKAVEGKRNVPLFGDQMRNARMLVRHGGAIMLQKFDIADAEKLRTAIATVLEDPSFNEKAQRLRQMLRNQPISPHELLLKHAEFAAR
ncbi:hypothetical protein RB195_006794 [Necator americanus]|uniref:glucuronosyltransferase n=1 Tax=Necator americanus TaxID=51031 RepID=A0ABR1BW09_NECAM